MKKSLCLLFIALVALFAFGCSTDDQRNSTGGNSDNSTNVSVSEEQRVINMFETYGSYQGGVFYINKVDGNARYTFCYKPSAELFLCSYALNTYAYNTTLYDYGSVSFGWKRVENGSFYAEHSLNFNYDITFNFYNITLKNGSKLGNNYTYRVQKNTFVNLTAKSDIDEYAQTAFECVKLAVGYAQTVLNNKCGAVKLW